MAHSDKNGYFSFSLQHLLDTLEFILFNTYIQFGQHLFLQDKKGIPMGGNGSSLITDLYPSWLEYKYLDILVKNKEFNLVNYLKYNCRFIDIVTPNHSCGLSTATIEYSSPSVCLCVCVSVCLPVCVHDNSKNNGSIDLKLEHIVVYENSSDEFDIGHCPSKVKVTA